MLFQDATQQALAMLKGGLLDAEEASRRARAAVRHQLLEGDIHDLVADRLRQVFASRDEANRVAVFGDATCNVFRFLVDEIAVYSGATRAFVREGQRDPVYAKIEEEEESFDLIMQDVARTAFAMRDGLIQVLPRPEGGRPKVRVFRPHECTVIWDEWDPAIPRAVFYEHRTQEGEEITIVWTETEHYIVHGGKIGPAPGAKDISNPLGRLPFTAFHSGLRADRFWDGVHGEETVQFTLDYLAGWAAMRWLAHLQSHQQIYVTGVDEGWRPPERIGPATIWKLTGNPNARLDTLTLQGDISALKEMLREALAEHIASLGLNGDTIGQNPGQAPASGLALYLDRHRVIERRRQMHPMLIEAEYALAELYRWAWNLSNPREQIDSAAVFEVELREETVILSPLEEQQARKTRLEVMRIERELGLKTVLEQVMEDRGISEEEARNLLPHLTARPEIFAYDQENAIVTIDEIRASKGLPAHPDREIGGLTVPQLRAKYPEWFTFERQGAEE